MSREKPLKICIFAEMIDGAVGGNQQFVLGLAAGLSQLTDGDEEYYFLTYPGFDDWLLPYLNGPCRTLHAVSPFPSAAWRQRWKLRLRTSIPAIEDLLFSLRRWSGNTAPLLPVCDRAINNAAIDLIHFTTTRGFTTRLPNIYQFWDIMHLELPELFRPHHRAYLEYTHRALSTQADLVVTASNFVRQQLIEHYQLAGERLKVVPLPPINSIYPIAPVDKAAELRDKYQLPAEFLCYPSRTWPHKNHAGLFEALVILRERENLIVPCVFTGPPDHYLPELKARAEQLGIAGQLYFLNYVSPGEMQTLYKIARGLIFPSKAEGFGMPISEAFYAGIPVACSQLPPIEEQAGDAACYFDPNNVAEIAEAINLIWRDESIRKSLIERGHQQIAKCSWLKTAKTFRAYYRRLCRRRLSEEDLELIETLIVRG